MKNSLLLIFIISLLFTSRILSQDIYSNFVSEHRAVADEIFSEINPKKIKTGLLIERSLNQIDLSLFDGNDNSASCNYESWLTILLQLQLAHINANSCKYALPEVKISASVTDNDMLKIGIALYRYNTINLDYIVNRKLYLDTIRKKFIDKSGIDENPFKVKSCFASTITTPYTYEGIKTFNISSELFLSNVADDISNLYIDFDNGNGYVKTSIGSDVTVDYYYPGKKNIKIKAVIDGRTYFSFTELEVREDQSRKRANDVYPDLGPEDFYGGGVVSEYGIYFRCNTDNRIRKPYIIVSGFDSDDRNRVATDAGDYDKLNLYTVANQGGYLDKLREDGYDIILYRPIQSSESIIKNAMNLVDFIQKINREKTSDNEIIINGASMGGLLVRYALTYMEHNGIDHQTKLFISLDSPQEGANVPLGFQFMLSQLISGNNIGNLIMGDEIKEQTNIALNSCAAREMILYSFIDKDGNPIAAPQRDKYLEELEKIGNFPRNCRTAALSMGSGVAKNQGFTPSQKLIEKDAVSLFGLLSGVNVIWRFKVFAMPDKTNAIIYKEATSREFCSPTVKDGKQSTICMPVDPFPDIKEVSVNGGFPIDNAPGSTGEFHTFKENDAYEQIGLLMDIGSLYINPNSDCFIPTISALGLKNVDFHTNIKDYFKSNSNVHTVSDNVYLNIGGKNFNNFDLFYVEDDNINHLVDSKGESAFTDNMMQFLKDETSPSNLYLESKLISANEKEILEARNTIFVGNDVDADKLKNGNVSVEKDAKLSMLGGDNIKLTHGFHAKSGSNVSMKAGSTEYCSEGTVVTLKSDVANSEISLIENQKEIVQNEKIYDIISELSKPVLFHPNPAHSEVVISSNKENNELTVTDANGKNIIKSKFEKNTKIDVSALPLGIYIFTVLQSNGDVITEKIIKE
ncbi:MAG: T9SS type A sorting domain-containing protein [Bacteroidales bacterium]|nr:T9SS type A sorting domain-containing protein [Bacteroidales bacterium]